MVALIIIFALLVLIFYIGSEKAQERGHDGLAGPLVIIFVIVMMVLNIKSCVSNTDFSPRYDYYDDRTPR